MPDTFRVWLADLQDYRAKARITARIRAAGLGHLRDVEPVGASIFEMQISYGPGYRVY